MPIAPNLILPVGTQVVTRVEVKRESGPGVVAPGAVGIVVASPADSLHAYRVRLVGGQEVALQRREFAIRKEHETGDLVQTEWVLEEHDLFDCVVYRCVVGSKVYGLDVEGSDTDLRGIYLPPCDLDWSLHGVPERIEDPKTEECYWEIKRFLVLALKANPNILECLYTPLVELATPLAQELLEMRSAFLSRLVYTTFNGYVLSQFRKLEADIRTKGVPKWKHVMHLVRLLLSGIRTLRDGFLPVHVGESRDRLLAIRRGEVDWGEVDAWRLELHREFDAAVASSPLPERPDYARVNAFLIAARRRQVKGAG